MSESRTIEAETLEQAWRDAVVALLAAPSHRLMNLIVRIHNPQIESAEYFRVLDAQLGGLTVRAVARTIMPFSVLRAADWAYRTHRLAAKLPHGSYFKRMVDYEGDGGTVNQIANVISALLRATPKGRWVDPIPIVLERPGRSAPAHVGFPCLSLVQFHRVDKCLHMTGVYRSHFYHDKAYGNFVGLGRLQRLVARESCLMVGELTVVSTDARLEKIGAVKRVLQALEECTS